MPFVTAATEGFSSEQKVTSDTVTTSWDAQRIPLCDESFLWVPQGRAVFTGLNPGTTQRIYRHISCGSPLQVKCHISDTPSPELAIQSAGDGCIPLPVLTVNTLHA